jgi:hypothetical protein
MNTRESASERVSKWPEWKRKMSDAWMAQLKENQRIIRERIEYIRKYGEQ